MQIQKFLEKRCSKLLNSKVLERIEDNILSLDVDQVNLKKMELISLPRRRIRGYIRRIRKRFRSE